MRKFITVFSGVSLLAVIFIFAQVRPSNPVLTDRTLTVDNRERTFRLFVPGDLPKDKKIPLVFVFHGGGSGGITAERLTNFSRVASREKFVVVYPEGIEKSWNDGREAEKIGSQSQKIDDVAFVRAMIDSLSKEYRIDEKRIFATGISNGAIFSHYLAANMPDKVAAIAPVVGGIADPFYKNFKPKDAVSVFILQGTGDPLVPYGGGAVAAGISRDRGRVASTDDAVRFWTLADQTSKDPIKENLPDTNQTDGCTVESFLWTKGRRGTEVKLYKQNGGGHTWAGGNQYLPKFLIGSVCRDFDATEEIWKFFEEHPKQ